MKTLYIDCGMGAAGDMLTSALLELFEDKKQVVEELNAIGIPTVTYESETVFKCGIMGTNMHVRIAGAEEGEDHEHDHEHHHDHQHDHHHEHGHDHDDHHHDHQHDYDHHLEHDHDHHHAHVHTSLHDVEQIVEGLNVSPKVKEHALEVYKLIAEAESHAHGKPVTEIHFHEVGTMDAIADVVAVCHLIEKLAPQQIIASPVHVGSGHVHCAHGCLPVPAPATAYILKEVPMYGGKIQGELCTPTGAALLKHFVTVFGDMPTLAVTAVGYGMGKKDFEAANCVRVMLGDTKEASNQEASNQEANNQEANNRVVELACNLDDMTPEAIGFAMDMLFEGGALDVFTTAVGMKKNRPGIMLTVLCTEEDAQKMRDLIFKHTTTIGVRVSKCERYTLSREIVTEQTKYGPVRKKITRGYHVTREKFEYDDLAKIAKENNLSIQDLQM